MAFVIGSRYCPVEIARTKSWGIWVIYVGQVRSGVACEFQLSLSLSLFPGFGNLLLRRNFRFPFPIENPFDPRMRISHVFSLKVRNGCEGEWMMIRKLAKINLRTYLVRLDLGKGDRWEQREKTVQDY